MSLTKQRFSAKYTTRARLVRTVGGVLSGPLAVLEMHIAQSSWITSLSGAQGAARAHAGRLREVLDRDRALAAAQPSEPVTRPAVAPVSLRANAEASARMFDDEPIRTRTMARLLAAQGHRLRALAIYDGLLARDGADPGLRAEAELLRCDAPKDPA